MPERDPQRIFLSVRHVAERFDVSPTTIWRWSGTVPSFPLPVRFGSGCTRWRLSDIERFEATCGAAVDARPSSRDPHGDDPFVRSGRKGRSR